MIISINKLIRSSIQIEDLVESIGFRGAYVLIHYGKNLTALLLITNLEHIDLYKAELAEFVSKVDQKILEGAIKIEAETCEEDQVQEIISEVFFIN